MLELLVTALGSSGGKDLEAHGAWQGLEMIGYVRSDGVPLSRTSFIRNVEQLAGTQQVLGSSCLRDATGNAVEPARVAARKRLLLRDFARAVLQS